VSVTRRLYGLVTWRRLVGEEQQKQAEGAARAQEVGLTVSANTLLQIVLMCALGVGGVKGNSKLDEIGASVTRLDGKLEHLETAFVELRTKVDATEQLRLDVRLRALEQLGAERRLDALEADQKSEQKKGK
jgi:outer membrane murein-binding lipoprotein Lpp